MVLLSSHFEFVRHHAGAEVCSEIKGGIAPCGRRCPGAHACYERAAKWAPARAHRLHCWDAKLPHVCWRCLLPAGQALPRSLQSFVCSLRVQLICQTSAVTDARDEELACSTMRRAASLSTLNLQQGNSYVCNCLLSTYN